ncbi:hypothetical protein PROFUN_04875 [Planoprotostelium fungivorum]|uniref:Uncharacterized protein n=1 Tax=Planoprotostelium fungivorum TaxID=1890364 RepID=A0A2P6NF28_9EUKA|nr:hypothetical protein PROFUN_04875 [Planoprotostelium fungivorum]
MQYQDTQLSDHLWILLTYNENEHARKKGYTATDSKLYLRWHKVVLTATPYTFEWIVNRERIIPSHRMEDIKGLIISENPDVPKLFPPSIRFRSIKLDFQRGVMLMGVPWDHPTTVLEKWTDHLRRCSVEAGVKIDELVEKFSEDSMTFKPKRRSCRQHQNHLLNSGRPEPSLRGESMLYEMKSLTRSEDNVTSTVVLESLSPRRMSL